MNNKILSNSDIETIEHEISIGNQQLSDGIEKISALISQFENEEIVQTFFVSGNFGEQERQKLLSLKDIINKELANIGDNLVPSTKAFLERQRSLNERGVE